MVLVSWLSIHKSFFINSNILLFNAKDEITIVSTLIFVQSKSLLILITKENIELFNSQRSIQNSCHFIWFQVSFFLHFSSKIFHFSTESSSKTFHHQRRPLFQSSPMKLFKLFYNFVFLNSIINMKSLSNVKSRLVVSFLSAFLRSSNRVKCLTSAKVPLI